MQAMQVSILRCQGKFFSNPLQSSCFSAPFGSFAVRYHPVVPSQCWTLCTPSVPMSRPCLASMLSLFIVDGLMMPEEAAQQTRVFMSTATSTVWANDAPDVQGSLALLANTLVKYQPVVIYVSPNDVAYMQSLLNSTVTIVEFQARNFQSVTPCHIPTAFKSTVLALDPLVLVASCTACLWSGVHWTRQNQHDKQQRLMQYFQSLVYLPILLALVEHSWTCLNWTFETFPYNLYIKTGFLWTRIIFKRPEELISIYIYIDIYHVSQ